MTGRLRLASFNIESLDDGPAVRVPLAARLPVLRPQLLRLDADILCLQEVNAQRDRPGGPRHLGALDRLLEGTPYAAFERAISLGITGKGLADHHNLVLLSRWPLKRWRSLRHALVPPPALPSVTAAPAAEGPAPVEWDRPVLHASVALPGGRVLEVVNLHLRAPLATPIAGQRERPLIWKSAAGWAEGFFHAEVKRSGQALEVRLLVDSLFDTAPEALIAVCGDFNARERETPVRLIRAGVEDTQNGGLAGRELIALARSLAPAQRFSVAHGGERALYDHLLVSRALSAGFRHFELHNEALAEEEAVGPDTPFSFHAPLVAEFDLDALAP